VALLDAGCTLAFNDWSKQFSVSWSFAVLPVGLIVVSAIFVTSVLVGAVGGLPSRLSRLLA
jgi:hypothetical protein